MQRLRRLGFAVAVAIAAACGSPTRPSAEQPEAARYGGVWQVQYRLTQCAGPRHCKELIGTSRSLTMRLVQTGSTLGGIVEMEGRVVEVSGTVDTDEQLPLSGTAPAASPQDYLGTVNVALTARSMTPETLAGTVTYVMQTPPKSVAGELEITLAGGIVAASRREFVPTPQADAFVGTWRGRFLVRACTVVGSAYCLPHDVDWPYEIELRLSQRGSSVSGELRLGNLAIPVSGTVDGGRLALQGSASEFSGQAQRTYSLTKWSATRDKLGRLSGALSYVYEAFFLLRLVSTYDAELWDVTIIPDSHGE